MAGLPRWEKQQQQLKKKKKNPPTDAGDIRGVSLIPGSEISPRGGHGNPRQYSYLENPMDRRAWWATVHGVTKSWTQLKQLSMHTEPKFQTDLTPVFQHP